MQLTRPVQSVQCKTNNKQNPSYIKVLLKALTRPARSLFVNKTSKTKQNKTKKKNDVADQGGAVSAGVCRDKGGQGRNQDQGSHRCKERWAAANTLHNSDKYN